MIFQRLLSSREVVYFLMVKVQPHERAGSGLEAQRVLMDLVFFIAVLVKVPGFAPDQVVTIARNMPAGRNRSFRNGTYDSEVRRALAYFKAGKQFP